MRQVRTHEPEFKAKIVALVRAAQAAGTPSVASIAKEHGLGSSLPYEWLKAADKAESGAFTNKKYDPEYKARLVARFRSAKAAGVPISSIVKEENLKGDSLLYQWVKQADAADAKAAKADKRAAKKEERAKSGAKGGKATRRQYTLEFKQRAVSMHQSGMSFAEVGRKLEVGPAQVHYWCVNAPVKGARETSSQQLALVPLAVQSTGNGASPVQQVRPLNGHAKDALLYLRHAERDILDSIRDGKISRPDSAHLLTLLALQELSKAINS